MDDTLLKFILCILIFIFGVMSGEKISSIYYKKIIAENKVEQDKKIQENQQETIKILAERDDIKQGAIDQHAKDQRTINDLRSSIYGLQVHIPTCSGTVPPSADGNQNPNGGAGVFSKKVDAAFADLQRGVSDLVSRCDQLNIDAIQNNNMVH